MIQVKPEAPNTVSGLLTKRRELAARLKIASADVRAFTSDIDALDIVIRIFAPEIDGRGLKAKRLPSPFVAKKGEMQRVALNLMREAESPITLRQWLRATPPGDCIPQRQGGPSSAPIGGPDWTPFDKRWRLNEIGRIKSLSHNGLHGQKVETF